MGSSRVESAHNLEPMVLRLLRKLMKPTKVKGLVFTSCGRRTVRGIIFTQSSINGREVVRNFEVGGFKGCSIGFASVDGKRLFETRTKRLSSRRS